jgi:hypothetical protein
MIEAAAMTETCTAKWKGGRCDKEASAAGLCTGHYQQKRREKPFAPLRGAHGDMGTVQVVVQVIVDDAEVIALEAARREVPRADVYREAIEQLAQKLRNASAKKAAR